MPATFKNGQFEINDDGDFVFLDENDNTVFQYNTTTGNLELGKSFDVSSNQILNAILGTALNANSNDINNVGALGATSGTFSGAVSADSASVTNDVSADTATITNGISGASVDTDEVQNQDYNESVTTYASASGTVTLDLSTANVHRVEASGNVTLEVSNVTGTPPGNSVLIKLTDSSGTGPHTITYGTSWNTILWDNGIVRDTIPATSNIRLSFETDDGGTNWWAIRSGRDFA